MRAPIPQTRPCGISETNPYLTDSDGYEWLLNFQRDVLRIVSTYMQRKAERAQQAREAEQAEQAEEAEQAQNKQSKQRKQSKQSERRKLRKPGKQGLVKF